MFKNVNYLMIRGGESVSVVAAAADAHARVQRFAGFYFLTGSNCE